MLNKLSLKKLIKIYRDNIKATDNVSVEFLSGEITALIGHNGAGKTTLLGQINGLIKPDSGSIELNNYDLVKDSNLARKLVSSMPQFQAPIKGVSMQEVIESVAMIKGLTKIDAKSKTSDLIKYLKLEDYKNISGEKLSGGLQRLTSFAMSVVDEPSVLVLDEPTNDVDPIRRELLWKYLRKLANAGSIILIVTHNILEVEKYADRYILLEKGKIKKDIYINSIDKSIFHILEIEGIEKYEIKRFNFSKQYDCETKKLNIILEDNQLVEVMKVVLELLEDNKIVNYSLKIATLNDIYEEERYE